MAWVPVDDSQTPNWSNLVPTPTGLWALIPSTNTPGWNLIQSVADGAFQFGCFQPAFQIGIGGSIWSPVDDSQTGVWTPVPP